VYHRRPPRLKSFDYRGSYRYFVTCCTKDRREVFTTAVLISQLVIEIRRTCAEHEFEVNAYVFMPDHLHILLGGCSERADFRATMTVIRQRPDISCGIQCGRTWYESPLSIRIRGRRLDGTRDSTTLGFAGQLKLRATYRT